MASASESTRVVITGLGTVTPVGIGNENFWSSLIAGRSAIAPLRALPADGFQSRLAAEITDFDASGLIYCRKAIKVMSRDTQFGTAAASMAMRDAGLAAGGVDPERLGVSFGCGRISTHPEEVAEAASFSSDQHDRFEFERWGEDSLGRIAPLWLIKRLPNMPACHISIEHDARGPNNTITCRESSALLAMAEGVRIIERDSADAVIVGACSSNIHPLDLTRFHLFENLSRSLDPARACRPFDMTRDGMVVGEGAAAFVLERYDHAVRRGATIYCEVLGVGSGCDGAGWNNGSGGRGVARAVQAVLRRASVEPGQIGHINAHGKSTQRDDLVEARGYHWAMGSAADLVPVTALTGHVGHFEAGSGAVDLAGCVLSMRHGVVPATLNYRIPDPRCRLNVVREPVALHSPLSMTVSRTSMGQSAAAILKTL